MASLKQIAEKCGVSIKTVSRALHNQGEVSADTRAKIIEVSEELNYSPNFSAQSLRTKKTNIVGLLRFSMNIEVWNQQARVITEEFSRSGYNILQGLFNDEKKMKLLINEFKQKCDGLIIYSHQKPLDINYINMLRDEGYPFAIVDPHPDLAQGYPTVSIDRERGVTEAVESLGRSGKTRLAMLSPFKEYVNRMTGFKQGLKNIGQTFTEDQILVLPLDKPDGLHMFSYDTGVVDHFMEAGYQTGLTHPDIGKKYNGIIAFDDKVALGCIRGLYERGIKVPKQVAVVGYDDDKFTPFTPVPMSTVRQPVEALSMTLVEMILKQFDGKSVESRTFATRFIKRQSS